MNLRSKPLIYIVDDNPVYLFAMEKQLTKEINCDVLSFLYWMRCMKKLYMKPDLILLDYFLDTPDSRELNGIEIMSYMKQVVPDCDIVIISAQTHDPSIVVRSYRAGAAGYLIKEEEDIVNEVKKLIEKKFQKKHFTEKWMKKLFFL